MTRPHKRCPYALMGTHHSAHKWWATYPHTLWCVGKRDRKVHGLTIKARIEHELWVEAMRMAWDRGARTRADMAAALGVSVPTLDQRLYRLRKAGVLPPARADLPSMFDPFHVVASTGVWLLLRTPTVA